MLSNTSSAPARRTRRHTERRTRRRPVFIATGLAFAVLASAGITATTPTSQAEASGSSFGAFELVSFPIAPEPTATSAAAATDDASTVAREALAAAETSLAAAETVTADIAASGLDLGVGDTSIDTDELDGAVESLDSATRNDTPFVSNLTDALTAEVAAVDERVAGLRGSLDAAIALKAAQEAAEKARREAEAAAAAKAAAEAEAAKAAKAPKAPARASAAAPVAPRYAASGTSAGEAQATARAMLGNYGWGDDQFSCLVSLWNRESGWNYQAYNRSSGAYGIPQALPGSKMGSAGADWQTNPATQIAWGFGYIAGRYGSPCGAWSHSQSYGWY
jgi:hypothetical protein